MAYPKHVIGKEGLDGLALVIKHFALENSGVISLARNSHMASPAKGLGKNNEIISELTVLFLSYCILGLYLLSEGNWIN